MGNPYLHSFAFICGQLLAGLLTASVLAGSPTAKTEKAEWPLFRGDSLSTGVAHSSLPDKLDVLWKFTPSAKGGGFEATAAIVDGVVYVGSIDGNLYAVDLKDGKEKWRFENPPLGFTASASVRDGRVFVGDADGKFFGLDASTGKPLWPAFEAGAEISSGANFYKDTVLFGSQDATLYSLDAKTGKLNWKHAIADQIRCFPTIVDDRLFLAGCDGKLHIIDIEKNQQVDAVDIEAPTGATAAVAGPRAFFGTSGASFFCIDWKEAKIVWSKSLTGLEFCTSAALTPEAVIVGCRDKQLRWLNPDTGEVTGSFRTRAKIESSPVVVGDRVFFGSYDGRLFAVDRKTYQKVWEFEGGSHFTASPAVADGRLVIGNSEGTLYCFGAKKQ